MSLRDAWDAQADDWVRWARAPGHDSYWRFHRDRFLEVVPPPGRLTVDLGCGEGRVARDLAAIGHRVVGVDTSLALLRAAAASTSVAVGDAARLPLRSAAADLVVAFMALQDLDDLDAALAEAARVLAPGGALCVAIVHPLNSAGGFEGDGPDQPFVVRGSYFEPTRLADPVVRDGLAVTFHLQHRSIERYSEALTTAGFVIEALREVGDATSPTWSRVPLFLDARARLA